LIPSARSPGIAVFSCGFLRLDEKRSLQFLIRAALPRSDRRKGWQCCVVRVIEAIAAEQGESARPSWGVCTRLTLPESSQAEGF